MDPIRVVIIGGGAAGVLVAARLLDASVVAPVGITIVEASGRLGAGVAYGTTDPDHLVNVRASAMSADPSVPGELLAWAVSEGIAGEGADTFIARRDFHRYLRHHLQTALDRAADATLETVEAAATSLRRRPRGVLVELDDGDQIAADVAVLALGNPPPSTPAPFSGLEGSAGWVPDPWAPGALASLSHADRVLLVGSGLTMVDAAITLARDHDPLSGTSLQLTSVSRSGLLPAAHLDHQADRPLRAIDLDRDGSDVRQLAHRLRERCVHGVGAEYPDENWREVIDHVRPFANALWRRYDRAERTRFITELAREWDVHRHRMAPAIARRITELCESSVLEIQRARPISAEALPRGGVAVTFSDDSGDVSTVIYNAVVNCTGPGRPWLDGSQPLIADLVESGRASPDELQLGLKTDEHGSPIGTDGSAWSEVLVIGTLRRGTLWETTAVPELRSQALHIADRIIADA